MLEGRQCLIFVRGIFEFRLRLRQSSALEDCKTDLLFPGSLGVSDEKDLQFFNDYCKSTRAQSCAYDYGQIGCVALNSSLATCGSFCLAVAQTHHSMFDTS